MDYKEIYKEKEAREGIIEGINRLADAVLTTMGPNGGTVIISDHSGDKITKDGVSVASEISFKDPIQNIGANLIKEVAKLTVALAGDGTTTSICLAKAFINKGFKLISENVSYNIIKKELEELEIKVIKELGEVAIKLNRTNIIDVATISANNDVQIGKLIQKAYNHSDIVRVEEYIGREDLLETVNGMRLNTSYFSKAFINNGKKQAIEYDEVKFIIKRGKLESLKSIYKLLEGNQDLPIIIMADHFTEDVLSLLKTNYNKNYLQIGLVKTPGVGGHRKDLVSDIIEYTGAKALSSSEGVYFSRLDSVFINKDYFDLCKKDADVSEYANNLKETLNLEENTNSRDLISQRITNLNGKVSIIKVGGSSTIEMKERKDRVDDAVLAVLCALEEGIIAGGGITLNNMNIDNLFSSCLKEPLKQIQSNGSDLKECSNQDLLDKNIIDPVKVTRCAIQNAISVTKTILGTKTIVLNNI